MSEFYFVIQVPALVSQTEKYVDGETSDKARKLEIKEFSNANFIPFVCENKSECSNVEEKDEEPEENSTTESILEFEEKNSAESEDGETPQTTREYQDHGDEDEARTEAPDLKMTTEFVEAQIPTMKELGEELLPYEGVIYSADPEEHEVEQTTAIFIPNGDKELLEVLPTKEPNRSDSTFQSTFALETTTEVTDYQEEEVTTRVPPKSPDLETTTVFDLFQFLHHDQNYGYLWS